MELTLTGNNVYRNGKALRFDNGENLLVRQPLAIQGSEEDNYYTVKEGDSLLLIAYNHYRSRVKSGERYWWIIADANNIENPLDIEHLVGQEILVPNILSVLLEL